METLKSINDAVRFLLEIISVIAIAYWGFNLKFLGIGRYFMGVGAPLIVVLIWSKWGAPMSEYHLVGFAKLALELCIFTLAIACLYGSHHAKPATFFAIAVAINTVLLYLL